MEKLNAQGIFLKNYGQGSQKIICPQCSRFRKKSNDPCLNVTIENDGAVWYCHHCEWSGGTHKKQDNYKPKRNVVPLKINLDKSVNGNEISEKHIQFFKDRKISLSTVKKLNIYSNNETICFPYEHNGEIVNIKYRTMDKQFRQVKDAKRTLYNIDSLKNYWDNMPKVKLKSVIFVEGEMDVLALMECGYKNVVSLADGAPKTARYNDNDKRFEAFENSKWIFDAEEVIIATDIDDAGNALKLELIHRFGKDICKVVTYPNAGDWQCKDANECLIDHGEMVLKECISLAEPFPVLGLHGVLQYNQEVQDIYDGKTQKAFSTGYANLDSIYKIMPSTFNLITGIPNHGKSNFLDQVLINLAEYQDWKFAIFSPEHSTPNHIRRLVEKVCRKPFDLGLTERIKQDELNKGLKYLDDHFWFIENNEEIPDIEFILSKAKVAKQRFGINGLVIDPFNQISPERDANKREDEHIRDIIAKCQQFARNHNIVVWMVAHPHKLTRDENGVIPPPNLYQVSGSAHWANMSDVAIVVHRDFEDNQTQIITRKIREQGVYGQIGQCFFTFNPQTRVYEEKI